MADPNHAPEQCSTTRASNTGVDPAVRTLAAYNDHTHAYLAHTPNTVTGAMRAWLDTAVDGLPFTARILEIGTGPGRDANYLEQQGYHVNRTDASEGFLTHLRAHGHHAHQLNVITDHLPAENDLILANAVLQHFNVKQTRDVLTKMKHALTSTGRLAITLKKGTGTAWDTQKLPTPRYTQYWTHDGITTIARQAGFHTVHNVTPEDDTWLHLIAHPTPGP